MLREPDPISRCIPHSWPRESSTKAEIIEVFVYHQQLLALRSLMMNLGFYQITPNIIHQDNQAAITILTRGAIDKGSTRHLQLRIARIHELVTDGIIAPQRTCKLMLPPSRYTASKIFISYFDYVTQTFEFVVMYIFFLNLFLLILFNTYALIYVV